jgi:hypothetical protein
MGSGGESPRITVKYSGDQDKEALDSGGSSHVIIRGALRVIRRKE